MSWIPPRSDRELSDHLLPVGWWEGHDDLKEPHTGQQLENWFNTNHKCLKCGRVIRSHKQADQPCKERKRNDT